MNILVIGGSGLFGRKIVMHLLRDREVSSVVSMDIVPPGEWFNLSIREFADKFCFISKDVSELENILDIIKTHSIDRIINMAFILAGAFEKNPRLAVRVNTLGMCNVFEAARLAGISRVVYASSVAVYGAQREYGDREVNEDDFLHPGNGYGVTKQLSEILAAQYSELYGIKFSAIRPFLGYGYGGVFPPIIKQFSDAVSLPAVGQPFFTDMDGTGLSALSSAEDVAALTCILIKAPSSPHPAYNVASPPTSLRDVADAVHSFIPDARMEFGHQAPPAEAARSGLPWKVSMARAIEDLGFSPLPLEKSVLAHINDARSASGLKALQEMD